MLSIKLMALVALAGLAQGSAVSLILPDNVKDPTAQLVAENLAMGSLAPHVTIDLIDTKAAKVQLTAVNDCQCFGRLVKAGEAALVLDFVNGTDPAVALALTELLINGKLHDKIKVGTVSRGAVTTAKAEAEAKAKAEAEAKAKAEAEAKAKAEAEASGNQSGGNAAGPATAGGNRRQ